MPVFLSPIDPPASRRLITTATIFIIALSFVLLPHGGKGATRDTVLNTVYSNPFFYNVLKDKKGVVFAGTSEGIFRLEGVKLLKVNDQEGYVMLDSDGTPAIQPEGIRNYSERDCLYLLPYPEQVREEYHSGTDQYLYVCAGGRMFIFDIVPYSYRFANHSIRTISEHFVGTYSGIYLNGTRLDNLPSFTDGYIREFDDRAFICYDWMLTIEPEAVRTGQINNFKQEVRSLNSQAKVQFRDIVQSNLTKKFFISSVTDLLRLDKPGDEAVSIYKCHSHSGNVVIIGEQKMSLYFSDSIYIVKGNLLQNAFDTVQIVPEPIQDGCATLRSIYVLTAKGIYVMNSDNSIEKLSGLSKAHTMEMISGTEMIISTDNGLFRFNTVNRVLTPLIKGVEFNRRALFVKNGLISAGSINGLYTINVNDLDILARKNESRFAKTPIPRFFVITIIASFAAIAILLILLIRSRRKLKGAKTQINELNLDILDHAKIEQYILENLSTASLKSITNHFNTNNSHIYRLLEPDKPGSIIQKLRLQKVKEMQKAGKDVSEISATTGLSELYIRKILWKTRASG